MSIYLLCAANGDHYCGSTPDARLPLRLAEHRAGRGARIVGAWAAQGVAFTVARTWGGWGRAMEERLKARHRLADFCPPCSSARGRRPSSPLRARPQLGQEWLRRAVRHGRATTRIGLPLTAALIRRGMRRDAWRSPTRPPGPLAVELPLV